MNILAVDDERLALAALTSAIEEAEPEANINGFRTSTEALASLEGEEYDVAFLDIELRECTGLELAEKLRQRCPKLHIVFVTGYSEYALDAFTLHANGYVLKPVSPERIREELDHLQTHVHAPRKPEAHDEKAQLRFQCLGNFEVFANGEPLIFGRVKTKELLAYLVDRRGAMCTNRELIAALWEEDGHEPYLRQLKKDLSDTLDAAGFPDVLTRKRGSIGIVVGKVSCDYYDLLEKGAGRSTTHQSEYMEQYSWAERTKGTLWGHPTV